MATTGHSGHNVASVRFYASTSSRCCAHVALATWCADWEPPLCRNYPLRRQLDSQSAVRNAA